MVIKSRLRYLIAERELKEGKRLSLKRLARETNLAESTLHNLANNATQRFDGPVLAVLCAYFGVPLSELLVYEPEEATDTMRYQLPTDADEGFNELTQYYQDTIRVMPEVFTSHQFILKLAQHHQREYIGALVGYVNSNAPFQALHTRIAKKLHEFADMIGEVPSTDIFGQSNTASQWRKRR